MNPEGLDWMAESQREAIIAEAAASLIGETEQLLAAAADSVWADICRQYIAMKRAEETA